LKTLLERLSDVKGVELIEQGAASVLVVRKSDGLWFNLTVPHAVLEWFVDAYDDSGVIWSDWADYYPVEGESREQLASEMVRDLERCVTILVAAETRVLQEPKESKRAVELKVGDIWHSASLALLTFDEPDGYSVLGRKK
jgi:hypothetical protein